MATRQDTLAHDHMFLGDAHDENARRTLWVVLLTAIMMVAEIAAGYWTGSMALLADGFHMATHAGALGVAAAAYGYARRHARDPRFSFGTGKVGDLSGFASALVLGMVSLGIGVESVVRLFEPATVAFGEATVIAAIGLAVNVASAVLLSGGHGHGHGHDHAHGHGHDHGADKMAGAQDNNMRAAYVHVLADALTSVLAIAALMAGRYLGWVWLDPAMGIVGSIVIARWAWTLMRDTGMVLLDATDVQVADEIRTLVEAPGDARIVTCTSGGWAGGACRHRQRHGGRHGGSGTDSRTVAAGARDRASDHRDSMSRSPSSLHRPDGKTNGSCHVHGFCAVAVLVVCAGC